MKQKIIEKIEIPEGVSCSYENGILKCQKSGAETSREIKEPKIKIKIEGQEIILEAKKGNKSDFRLIKTYAAHIRNLFWGLSKKFTYILEICHVHFPVTLKVENDVLTINNFLGEKTPRHAEIIPNVHVEIKGSKIIVSSSDKEAAGQTAANFEKATKIRSRDRRIFQDGIFLVEKPGREI
ncbi:50S ribosomal protein L6 [Candidatus Pacearchaeota archaeon]|nr:50S ribosomal protein L6 [Candidatus Pacearchaeota archaeon]